MYYARVRYFQKLRGQKQWLRQRVKTKNYYDFELYHLLISIPLPDQG